MASRVLFASFLLLAACGEPSAPSAPRAAVTPKVAVKPAAPAPKLADPTPDPTGPFRLRGDAEIDREIEAAKVQAATERKRVLLEFLAEWCEDCQEVVRVSALAPVPEVVSSLYVTVPINVGRMDRAKLWREAYNVTRIATLVVLEPNGKRVAQTTLEPITGTSGPLTAEALAAWLREPMDAPKAVAPAAAPAPEQKETK